MKELMYDINSGLIAGILLVSLLAVIEAGFRYGLRIKDTTTDASKEQIATMQSSILGILALLLAFTFSQSLQRFDSRSEAVVDEANAIGTAWLRTQLLPAALRDELRPLLRSYLDVRLQASDVSMVDDTHARLLTEATRLQNSLWDGARRAAAAEPNPVTSGLFIQSLNDMIDSFGRRDATITRHVPEVVLLLLYATFLIAGAIIGLTAGVRGHRPPSASFAMVVLIVVLVFVILDLDRPKRGLIHVDQKSLLDLQASLAADATPSIKPVAPR